MSWSPNNTLSGSPAVIAAGDSLKDYGAYAEKFIEYHGNPVNVLCHLVTTPIGLIGAVSLLRCLTASSSIALAVVFLYLISLLPTLTAGVYIGTAVMCIFIVAATRSLKLSTFTACVSIAVCYALQDLAHMGTGEKTMQSVYSGSNGHVSPNPNTL